MPAAAIARGKLLLADDLATNTLGWTEGPSAASGITYGFEGGRYHIRMTQVDRRAVALPAAAEPDRLTFGDFVLEVDAALVAGANNQSYGVFFRYRDTQNHYLFEVSGLGDWHLVKAYQGRRVTLVDWGDPPAIRSGLASNRLTVTARGSKFAFYVNGEQVGSAVDADLAAGKPGFAVATWRDGATHVAFSTLRVWAAP